MSRWINLEIPRKYDYHAFMENPVPASILPRVATAAIERALRTAPVVVLLGARQTGKTTLVRSLPQLAGRPYLTLDDFDLRVQAEADPESLVATGARPGARRGAAQPRPVDRRQARRR